MEMRDSKITSGRPVRPQIIGHKLVRNKSQFLQQFPHQFQCSPLVPLALHQNVEDFALSIDGTPQVDQPAIDFDEYLVKMPSGMRLGPAPSKVSCDQGTEVIHPATHRFIGSDDPALSQQILDIAKAEAEPGIEPDGLLNDHGGKAVSGVADLGHNGRLPPGITADKPNNVTMPVEQVNAALGYITANAAELNVDPQIILLTGDSAGAQIAAQIAIITTDAAYAEGIGIAPK